MASEASASKLEQERAWAQKSGWNRVGVQTISVKVSLSDGEKIHLGQSSAANQQKIQGLKERKKAHADMIKADIEMLEGEIFLNSRVLNQGYREEDQEHSVFFDPHANQRVFVDIETGEEIARQPAAPEDRQLRIV